VYVAGVYAELEMPLIQSMKFHSPFGIWCGKVVSAVVRVSVSVDTEKAASH